jgi:hypothetical protein
MKKVLSVFASTMMVLSNVFLPVSAEGENPPAEEPVQEEVTKAPETAAEGSETGEENLPDPESAAAQEENPEAENPDAVPEETQETIQPENNEEETEENEQHAAEDFDEHTVPGAALRPVGVALSQAAAEQAVDAGAHAGGQRNHQHLEGHGEGNSGQAVGIKTRNEDAVHNVVKRLDEHGKHDGDADFGDKTGHRHGAEQLGTVSGLHNGFLSGIKINADYCTDF